MRPYLRMFQARLRCDCNIPRVAQSTPSRPTPELRPEPLAASWAPLFLSTSAWSLCKSHQLCLQNTPGSEFSSLPRLLSSGPKSLSALTRCFVRASSLVALFPHLAQAQHRRLSGLVQSEAATPFLALASSTGCPAHSGWKPHLSWWHRRPFMSFPATPPTFPFYSLFSGPPLPAATLALLVFLK